MIVIIVACCCPLPCSTLIWKIICHLELYQSGCVCVCVHDENQKTTHTINWTKRKINEKNTCLWFIYLFLRWFSHGRYIFSGWIFRPKGFTPVGLSTQNIRHTNHIEFILFSLFDPIFDFVALIFLHFFFIVGLPKAHKQTRQASSQAVRQTNFNSTMNGMAKHMEQTHEMLDIKILFDRKRYKPYHVKNVNGDAATVQFECWGINI